MSRQVVDRLTEQGWEVGVIPADRKPSCCTPRLPALAGCCLSVTFSPHLYRQADSQTLNCDAPILLLATPLGCFRPNATGKVSDDDCRFHFVAMLPAWTRPPAPTNITVFQQFCFIQLGRVDCQVRFFVQVPALSFLWQCKSSHNREWAKRNRLIDVGSSGRLFLALNTCSHCPANLSCWYTFCTRMRCTECENPGCSLTLLTMLSNLSTRHTESSISTVPTKPIEDFPLCWDRKGASIMRVRSVTHYFRGDAEKALATFQLVLKELQKKSDQVDSESRQSVRFACNHFLSQEKGAVTPASSAQGLGRVTTGTGNSTRRP